MTNTIAPPTLEELNLQIELKENSKNYIAEGLKFLRVIDIELYCLYAVRDGVGAKRQAELEDANNACIELAAKHGYATGHGDTVGDIIREFNSQIPSLAQSPWMDIETAPRDGTRILLCQAFFPHLQNGVSSTILSTGPITAATWSVCGDWRFENIHVFNPTHWMPLPIPSTHNSPPDAKASHNHGEDKS